MTDKYREYKAEKIIERMSNNAVISKQIPKTIMLRINFYSFLILNTFRKDSVIKTHFQFHCQVIILLTL